MHGFHGHYLRIDLTDGTSQRLPLPETVLRRFLGGSGLGVWLLTREAPAGVDPLAPEAPLVFAFSPLVGTTLTTSAKFAVVAKSPLTGMVCDSMSSSHFAIEGKRMGVDAIVLVGACAAPSILVGETIESTDLWGSSPAVCEDALSARGVVAAIGTAGENGVRFATISSDGRHAGRGGLGAVMGAKKLKAIVVRGVHDTVPAHPERIAEAARELARRSVGAATAKYRELGTVSNLTTFDRLGVLPTRNFQSGTFAGAKDLAPESLETNHRRRRKSCASCTIGCEHVFENGTGQGTRLEYENLFALGPLCGVRDPDTVLAASRRCDELGLDTISTGGTIAFAMECLERGLLADGPRFGDGPALLRTIDDIAGRRGLGDLLAQGSRSAAISIGGDALDFAPQVKGLEMPGYEPRALQTMALGLAVGTRGADHNKSGAYEHDFSDRVDRLGGSAASGKLAVESEDRATLLDSLVLCKFLRGVFRDLFAETAELLALVTGWDVDAAELRRTSARIVNLKKAFNCREGWTPADDTLPRRFLTQSLGDGASRGARLTEPRLREMIRAYNLARGWNADGTLPRDVVAELDLGGHAPADGVPDNPSTAP